MQFLKDSDNEQAMDLFERLRKEIKRLPGKRLSSVNQLALESGVDQSTLSKYLSGKGGISGKGLCKALEALGARIVFPDELEALTKSARVEELLQGKKLEQMTLTELGELFSSIISLLTDGRLRAELGALQLNPKNQMKITLDIEPAGEQKMEGDGQMPVKSQAS
jgi:transcriptional regulator with XRE-family HTH domain